MGIINNYCYTTSPSVTYTNKNETISNDYRLIEIGEMD